MMARMPRILGAIRFWSDGKGYFHSKKLNYVIITHAEGKKTGQKNWSGTDKD